MVKQPISRCSWVGDEQIYQNYHDEEWGVPIHNDKNHFELLILEGAQAGLSWITILKRREDYRQAFEDFNVEKVANFGELDAKRLLLETGIIRNKLKVASAIKNAQVFLQIQKEYGSFDNYIWKYVNGIQIINHPKLPADIQTTSGLSDLVSADLKSRGMSFVGSKIMYAYLQATGVINDHFTDCWKASK